MTKYFFFSLLIIAGVSCSEEKTNRKDGEVVSALAAGNETSAELKAEIAKIEAEEKQRIKDEAANVTTLSFDRVKHDFGEIPEDSDNLTEFIVTNTGNKPLVIDDVQASCGCTTPKKPTDPIMPGKTDVISVVFHPKPEQKNEIIKTVTVSANTEPRINTLTIRAFVK